MPKTTGIPEDYRTGWLDKLDGRLALAGEVRSRFAQLTQDLGGADRLSYAQRSLCERAIWLEYWLASQERELAAGREFDVGRWTQGLNSLQGVLSRLGLERKSRDLSLNDYLQKAGQ